MSEKEFADTTHDRSGALRHARVMTTAVARLRALGPGLMCARCDQRPWISIVQTDSGYRQFCGVCRDSARLDRQIAQQKAARAAMRGR